MTQHTDTTDRIDFKPIALRPHLELKYFGGFCLYLPHVSVGHPAALEVADVC